MKKLFLMISMCMLGLITWGQQTPDWKLGVSIGLTTQNLSVFFADARNAGIEYLEVPLPNFQKIEVASFVHKIEEYKKCANEAGLTIRSIHIPFGWDFDISTPDAIKQEKCKQYVLFTLDIAKGLGSYEKAILHPSFEPVDPSKRRLHIEALRTALKEIGPYVEKTYNVRLAIEDLPRTCLGNSSSELLEIIGDIPSVDVCFDSNHLLGEKPEHFIKQVGSRITTVHMSDYDEVDEKHWIPGKGVINWNYVVDALVKTGYKGPFIFEVTRTPWKGDSKAFCEDLAASWKKIQADYTNYLKSNQ